MKKSYCIINYYIMCDNLYPNNGNIKLFLYWCRKVVKVFLAMTKKQDFSELSAK